MSQSALNASLHIPMGSSLLVVKLKVEADVVGILRRGGNSHSLAASAGICQKEAYRWIDGD